MKKGARDFAPDIHGWEEEWTDQAGKNPIRERAFDYIQVFWTFMCLESDANPLLHPATKERIDLPQIEIRGAQRFAAFVQEIIEQFQSSQFVACVPMDRAFEQFPECSDFGIFKIVNVPQNSENVLDDFKRILKEKVDINFVSTSENKESYDLLANDYYRETRGYVPGRPQLLIDVGKGGGSYLIHALRQKLVRVLPLIRFAQLIYEYNNTLGWGDDAHSTNLNFWWTLEYTPLMPDRASPMPVERMELPLVSVFVNVDNGNPLYFFGEKICYQLPVDLFNLGEFIPNCPDALCMEMPIDSLELGRPLDVLRPATECASVRPYELAGFLKVWNVSISRILRFRDLCDESLATKAGKRQFNFVQKIADALSASLELVTSCLRNSASLPLHSVIALETILNPQGEKHELTERLSLFSAALLYDDAAQRVAAYQRVKKLYAMRCNAVHASKLFARDFDERSLQREAFAYFVAVLTKVLDWAILRIEQNATCTSDDFKEFYLRSIFGHAEE